MTNKYKVQKFIMSHCVLLQRPDTLIHIWRTYSLVEISRAAVVLCAQSATNVGSSCYKCAGINSPTLLLLLVRSSCYKFAGINSPTLLLLLVRSYCYKFAGINSPTLLILLVR